MLRKLFNYIADSLAWEVDLSKTKAYNMKAPVGARVDTNIYYINNRTGDRKIGIGRYSLTPPDMEWLAETKNKGIIEDFYSGTKTYTKKELQEHLVKCKNIKDTKSGPPNSP